MCLLTIWRAVSCASPGEPVHVSLCQECRKCWIESKGEKAKELGERALQLYQGDFLPEDIYEDWSSSPREKLKENYIWLSQKLAEFYWERKDIRAAIQQMKTALDYDPAREEIHRRLMEYYHALGERTQALRQYKQLKRILKAEFKIDPDPETEKIYNLIKR